MIPLDFPGNAAKSGSHSMPPPPRRNRTDSDLSSSLDEERPASRDHRGPPAPQQKDDRYRHSAHRPPYEAGRKPGYYDDYSRSGYKDYEYDDRHSSDSWERERHYEKGDAREMPRDARDKKDYENYSKSPGQQDSFVERDLPRDSREVKEERSERPQRPDSRDSRTSRDSRDDFHKPGSWANDLEYEDKKREMFREDTRERDRRQPPGPITREKLEADELKSEKRNLTQLKRGASDLDKKEGKESSSGDSKKDEAWGRKLEGGRTEKETTIKAWADEVSAEKEEEKSLEPAKSEVDVNDLKQSIEKLNIDKRDELVNEEGKDDSKDDKRDKNMRNRYGGFRDDCVVLFWQSRNGVEVSLPLSMFFW